MSNNNQYKQLLGQDKQALLAGAHHQTDFQQEQNKQANRVNYSPSSKSSQKEKQSEKEPQVPSISFFKLFTFVNCTQKVFIFIGTLASIATGVGLPLISILFGDITNDTSQDPSQIDSMVSQMKKTSYKMFYIGAGIFVASYFSFAFWMMTGERVAIQIRKAYFKAILKQDVEWFDTSNPQQLSTKINQQCTLVQKAVGEKVANVIMSLSMMVTGLFIAFFKGWQIALILLALAPLLVISVILLTKTVQGSEKQSQRAYAKSGGYAEECIGQIRTVASYCGEQKEVQKYVQHLDVAKRAGISSAIKAGLGTGIFWFSMFLAYGVGFYFGGLSIKEEWSDTRGNNYTSGEVITIFFAVIFGVFSLGMAAPNLRAIGEGLAAGSQIFATIERQPRINLGEYNDKIKIEDLNGLIEFNDVKFAYPSRPEQMVIKGVSLRFQPGRTIAIVGATGSGKSTIIQLIERFYDPISGNITIDGHQLKQLNINMLRKKLIGYVGQQPVLFNTSILENIRFGKQDATEQEVQQALKKANAWNFVQSLQDGIQTNVGAQGSQMSGGQKQRLAIARAIVKNPKILLLDEATSALDMRSEKVVQQALEKVSEGLTTIVIAHRLSTIQNADCIITLQKGEVAQVGTHEQLLENVQGVYANLVKAQIYQAQEDDDQLQLQLGENDEQQQQRLGIRQNSKNSEIEQDLVDLVNSNSQQQQYGSPVQKKNGKKIKDQFKTPLLEKKQSSQARPKRSSTKKLTGSMIANNPKKFLEQVVSQHTEQKKKLNELLEERSQTITSRLFQYTKKFPGSFCFGILSSLILGGTFPVFAMLFAQISVQMTAFNTGPMFDTSKNYDNFRLNCIYFVVIGVVSGFFQTLMVLFFSIIGQNITRAIREQLYKSILSRPISWFDDQDNEAGKLNSALSSDTSQLNSVVSQSVGMYFQSVASILLGVVFSMIFSWRLGLVLLGLSPFMLIAGAMEAKIQMGFSANIDQAYKESSSLVSESVANYRTVMSFANQDLILKHYEDKLNRPFSSGIKRSHISGLLFGFSQFSQWLVYGLAFFLAAIFLFRNWIDDSEHMFKAIYCLLFGAYGAGQAQAFAPDIVKAAQSAKSVFRLLDQPNDNNPFASEEESNGKLLKQKSVGRIQFKNVWFKYPSRKQWVLQGLNLVIEPGQSIALVGQSGCGKSTIISLLQKFYEIQRGQIILDGQNINDINLKSLRQQMALVSQEPLLFDATISQNIAYGRDNARFQEIAEAAENANAMEFIKYGEEGFDRRVGTRESQLSGGQKQRVAIARAILKKPSILLLDEATSALDKESEAIVQQALDKIMKFQTSIVIAHRLSTIEHVDQVFMLEEGKVVESGGYHQLLNNKDGAFHKDIFYIRVFQTLFHEIIAQLTDLQAAFTRDAESDNQDDEQQQNSDQITEQMIPQTSRQHLINQHHQRQHHNHNQHRHHHHHYQEDNQENLDQENEDMIQNQRAAVAANGGGGNDSESYPNFTDCQQNFEYQSQHRQDHLQRKFIPVGQYVGGSGGGNYIIQDDKEKGVDQQESKINESMPFTSSQSARVFHSQQQELQHQQQLYQRKMRMENNKDDEDDQIKTEQRMPRNSNTDDDNQRALLQQQQLQYQQQQNQLSQYYHPAKYAQSQQYMQQQANIDSPNFGRSNPQDMLSSELDQDDEDDEDDEQETSQLKHQQDIQLQQQQQPQSQMENQQDSSHLRTLTEKMTNYRQDLHNAK